MFLFFVDNLLKFLIDPYKPFFANAYYFYYRLTENMLSLFKTHNKILKLMMYLIQIVVKHITNRVYINKSQMLVVKKFSNLKILIGHNASVEMLRELIQIKNICQQFLNKKIGM